MASTTASETITFLAPVANVDESILKIPLKNGFEFLRLDQQKASVILAVGENSIPWSVGRKFFMDYPFLNLQEKLGVYFVASSFVVQPLKEGEDFWSRRFGELAQFDNQLVKGYLFPTIRKLKLFASGNIDVPFWYYFGTRDGKPAMLMGGSRGGYPTSRFPYHLTDDEIVEATHMIDGIQMPLTLPYLELAFGNYELSYQAPSNALAFLTLMICLETLFNSGEGKVRYQMSRNMAVFLGETIKESRELFNRVDGYYRMRSEIVHSGNTHTLQVEEIPKLRELCRIAIKRLVECNLEKDALLKTLKGRNYGSPIKS